MFWQKKAPQSLLSIACTLSENHYSLAVIANNNELVFHQSRSFTDAMLGTLPQSLAEDIDRMGMLAHDCTLVLLPEQYQLILMDALDLPESEMLKALRWNLKGLSDYDLDDVAIDTCSVPTTNNNEKKKIFVALTPLTLLNKKRAILEGAFLNVTSVITAEMGLKNLLPLIRHDNVTIQNTPIILVNLANKIRKIHIAYQDVFYLIRELIPVQPVEVEEPIEIANLRFEIEQSIDYCVNQLNLPNPKSVFFTPSFQHFSENLKMIGEALALTVEIIDLNQFVTCTPPLDLQIQNTVFYAVTGALNPDQKEPS